jgi:transposase
MSCSLQIAMWPHCSEVMVWVLYHEDHWREYSSNLFLQKTYIPWQRTTKWMRHSLCK